jgi:hypothetical protein
VYVVKHWAEFVSTSLYSSFPISRYFYTKLPTECVDNFEGAFYFTWSKIEQFL